MLGFPCNQFGAQEPGSNAEILEFATDKYQANFPLFAKIEVNGDDAADLYKYLRSAQPEPDGTENLPWNFTKFLVDRSGVAVARFAPTVTPEQLEDPIRDLLN